MIKNVLAATILTISLSACVDNNRRMQHPDDRHIHEYDGPHGRHGHNHDHDRHMRQYHGYPYDRYPHDRGYYRSGVSTGIGIGSTNRSGVSTGIGFGFGL